MRKWSEFVVLTVAALVFCLTGISQHPIGSRSTVAPENRVDINTASLDQILKIPGMTHIWAGRIIRFRPYRAKNELADRGVLPGDVYIRIRDYVIAHREKQ